MKGHREGWRVEARSGESWRYLLCLLDDGKLAPLPLLAAGQDHTLVRAAGGRVFAFGFNLGKQLGLGDSA